MILQSFLVLAFFVPFVYFFVTPSGRVRTRAALTRLPDSACSAPGCPAPATHLVQVRSFFTDRRPVPHYLPYCPLHGPTVTR